MYIVLHSHCSWTKCQNVFMIISTFGTELGIYCISIQISLCVVHVGVLGRLVPLKGHTSWNTVIKCDCHNR